ncbi:MAG: 3-methyl-2-oxobutanoate hydroxymethyltransferase [Gemmatimonadales bacterium]|nr:3-methyl-2-oxobutanoate hydroxymethyltransferase [Gemmatimonadales bacterium]
MKSEGKALTLSVFTKRKEQGRKIVVLTAYDLTSALIAAAGGVDAILVGDSVGMVVLGHENTLPVTLEDMLHHCRAVTRARPGVPVIADMPYGTFHVSPQETVRNALRLIKEGGAQAVKIEGGRRREPMIAALRDAEIPVMGHLGLTPQSVHRLGGYKVQGRGDEAAEVLREEAAFLAEAGCFAIVLECIPAALGATISKDLAIPTIGIGAGGGCDGQVLVFHDMLGLFEGLKPKFVKQYADLGGLAVEAVSQYAGEVRDGVFPGAEHVYGDKPNKRQNNGNSSNVKQPAEGVAEPASSGLDGAGYLKEIQEGKD